MPGDRANGHNEGDGRSRVPAPGKRINCSCWLDRRRWLQQTVTNPGYVLYVAGIVRGIIQNPTQFMNRTDQHSVRHGLIRPHGIKQLILGNDVIRI